MDRSATDYPQLQSNWVWLIAILPDKWLVERLEKNGVKTKTPNVTANCKSSLKKRHWCSQPKTLPTVSLKTHVIPKKVEFIISWKSSTLMFFFLKWYVTRRNKNSKSILITNTLYISPLHAQGPRRKFEELSLNWSTRRRRWLTWFCSTSERKGGQGKNQLCGLEMEKKHFYHLVTYRTLQAEAQLPSKIRCKRERLTTSHEHTRNKNSKLIGKIHLCPVQNMEKNLTRPTISDAGTTNK